MEKVLCRGVTPGTNQTCGEVIFHTDGKTFLIIAPANRMVKLEANPVRLKCKRCGYKTKLEYRQRVH